MTTGRPDPPSRLIRQASQWQEILANPLLISALTLAIVLALIVTLSYQHYNASFWRDMLVEAHGMLMDIVVFGIFLLWLNQKRDEKLVVQKYQEEIDDLRGWPSELAARRIRGNIRRLNKNRVTQIDLGRCYLRGVNLEEVNLERSILRQADLEKAQLAAANFRHADLDGANLQGANLQKIYLWEASLQSADLRLADLQGANLGGADLWEANLQDADLRLANLEGANLEGAFLRGANLQGANLRGTNLEGANLEGADLWDATLSGADVRGANLSGAHLTPAQLFDVATLYQAHLDPALQDRLGRDHPHLLEEPRAEAA